MLQRWKQSFMRFMYGRYGPDKLNSLLLILGVGFTIAGLFSSLPFLTLLSYVPLALVIFRMFSRNTYRRRLENQKYMQILSRIKDRDNRYFSCPACRQTVRVPRGRGKISIHCPKCGQRFVKKT